MRALIKLTLLNNVCNLSERRANDAIAWEKNYLSWTRASVDSELNTTWYLLKADLCTTLVRVSSLNRQLLRFVVNNFKWINSIITRKIITFIFWYCRLIILIICPSSIYIYMLLFRFIDPSFKCSRRHYSSPLIYGRDRSYLQSKTLILLL